MGPEVAAGAIMFAGYIGEATRADCSFPLAGTTAGPPQSSD